MARGFRASVRSRSIRHRSRSFQSGKGSQRRQIRAYAGRWRAIVCAGRVLAGRPRTTCSDGQIVTGGQGVAGSQPAVTEVASTAGTYALKALDYIHRVGSGPFGSQL